MVKTPLAQQAKGQGEGHRLGTPSSRRGEGAVFWLLTALAFSTFAPCVILPEWKRYEALSIQEQLERHRVTELQRAVDREKRLLEAIRTDPAVVTRLAQRDLGLSRRNERAILVSVPSASTAPADEFVPTPPEPPALVAKATSLLPQYDYIGLFCDNRTRFPILVLSVALMALAFALFGQRAAQPD